MCMRRSALAKRSVVNGASWAACRPKPCNCQLVNYEKWLANRSSWSTEIAKIPTPNMQRDDETQCAGRSAFFTRDGLLL